MLTGIIAASMKWPVEVGHPVAGRATDGGVDALR